MPNFSNPTGSTIEILDFTSRFLLRSAKTRGRLEGELLVPDALVATW
jgi:hypothetical protein